MCLGIPGKLVEVYQQDELPMGKAEFGGIVKEICLAYTPEASPSARSTKPRRTRCLRIWKKWQRLRTGGVREAGISRFGP